MQTENENHPRPDGPGPAGVNRLKAVGRFPVNFREGLTRGHQAQEEELQGQSCLGSRGQKTPHQGPPPSPSGVMEAGVP